MLLNGTSKVSEARCFQLLNIIPPINNNGRRERVEKQVMTRQGIIGSLEWIKNMREIIDRIRPVKEGEVSHD